VIRVKDYRETAAAHEELLSVILQDMKDKRTEREMGGLIPEDLEAYLDTEALFRKYSQGSRYGLFTILNFQKPDKNTAILSFQNLASLSGGGAHLVYHVDDDGTVKYVGSGGSWMS
jgi:hypothetical protein